MSGNEIYCLAKKGLSPAELLVGNSVFSLGVAGTLGSLGRALAGGEIQQITQLISDGRHAAMQRMEQEAARHGAHGITGVVSEVRSLAGYTEFLAQGTGVVAPSPPAFFTTSASGIDLYCHLDAGYQPIRFAMGNVAYALGLGRGLTGSLRRLARGEVKEYSQMYNDIRHLALSRLKEEAARYHGNSVVDLTLQVLPHASGALELLVTGTASFHPRLSQGPVAPQQVVTSELTGEEIWNLATMGYAPVSLVMGTSVYALGVAGSIGAMFQSMARGELPDLTSLVYHARENCLELVRREAQMLGAERVVGNRLVITELAPGLLEIFAIGTAVRRMDGMHPASPDLIPQAVIVERETLAGAASKGLPMPVPQTAVPSAASAQKQTVGCLAAVIALIPFIIGIVFAIISALSK
jgi:uncharacterized protein YbjQ (UPF0145 family)